MVNFSWLEGFLMYFYVCESVCESVVYVCYFFVCLWVLIPWPITWNGFAGNLAGDVVQYHGVQSLASRPSPPATATLGHWMFLFPPQIEYPNHLLSTYA